MNTIKGEFQIGVTNATQRLLELLDHGWIVEIRRGYDTWGRFDDTYVLHAKTNTDIEARKLKCSI